MLFEDIWPEGQRDKIISEKWMGLLSTSECWCSFAPYVKKGSFAFAGSAPFRFLVWVQFFFTFCPLFTGVTRKHKCKCILHLLGCWDYKGLPPSSILWPIFCRHLTKTLLNCVFCIESCLVFSRSDMWMNAQVSLLIGNKRSRSVYECWRGKFRFLFRIGMKNKSVCIWFTSEASYVILCCTIGYFCLWSRLYKRLYDCSDNIFIMLRQLSVAAKNAFLA